MAINKIDYKKLAQQKYSELSGVMFVVLDKQGVVQIVNKNGCKILGYAQKNIVGKNWFDNFIPLRHRKKVKHVFGQLIAGKIKLVKFYKNPVLTKNKQEKIISWHNVLLKDEKGQILATLSAGADVTKDVLIENALKESEERYRRIFEADKDALIVTDANGYVQEVNPMACKLYGYRCKEINGMPRKKLVHPDYQKGLKKIQEFAARGESYFTRTRHIRKNGTNFLAEVYSVPVQIKNQLHIIIVVRDITESERAERTIKESEAKFKTLFKESRDGLILSEAKTKKFIEVNPVICKMLGYTPEELKNLSVADIHPKETIKAIYKQFQEQVNGVYTLAQNSLVKRKDGSTFYADINATPLRMGGQKYLLGSFRDVTERWQFEKQLKSELNRVAKLNQIMTGRETRILEIKKEVNALLRKQGQPPKYHS
ncbi:MAG: PAS domain-containing protein [Pseudomonadota bacterium]